MNKKTISFFIIFLFSLRLYSQNTPELIVLFNPQVGTVEEGLESLSVTSDKLAKLLEVPGYDLKSVSAVLPEEKVIADFIKFLHDSPGLEFGNIIFTQEDKSLLAKAAYLVVPVIFSAQKVLEQGEAGSKLLGWKGRIGWTCVRTLDGNISHMETIADFPVKEGTTLIISAASDIEGLLKRDFFKLDIRFRAKLIRLLDNTLSGVQSYPGQFNPGEELTAWKRTDAGPVACGTFIVTAVSKDKILLDLIFFDVQLDIADVYLEHAKSLPVFLLPQAGVYFPDSIAASTGIKLVYEPMFLVFNGYVSASAMYHILNPVEGALTLEMCAGMGKRFNFGPLGAFIYLGGGGAMMTTGKPMAVVEYGLDAFFRFENGDGVSVSFSMINLLSDLSNSRSGFLISGGWFFNL